MLEPSPYSELVIVAPHPDDELIGCFSLLRSGQVNHVIYYHDLTEERKAETRACAEYYGFEPHYQIEPPVAITLFEHALFVLPSIKDSHRDHQKLNQSFRTLLGPDRRRFYSTNLDALRTKTPLEPKDRDMKRQALDQLYPSQIGLWSGDASYYLFEHVVAYDYSIYQTFYLSTFPKGNDEPAQHKVRVPDYCAKVVRNLNGTYVSADQLVDRLIHMGILDFEIEDQQGRVWTV